jgi:hypothetical protein
MRAALLVVQIVLVVVAIVVASRGGSVWLVGPLLVVAFALSAGRMRRRPG